MIVHTLPEAVKVGVVLVGQMPGQGGPPMYGAPGPGFPNQGVRKTGPSPFPRAADWPPSIAH